MGLLLLLLFTSCGGALRPWSIDRGHEDAYQRLTPPEVVRLRAGILSFEEGSLSSARKQFEALSAQQPEDLSAAVWLQETELRMRHERAQRFSFFAPDSKSPQAELRDTYRAAAEADPTPLAYFLAARIEGDLLSSNLLLQKALELDPGMSWAYYAMAYGSARDGEWAQAREHLDAVFELDPGHLPSIRLFGWLQAQVGDVESAVPALEAWRESAAGDMLAGQATQDRVSFNLALAYTSEESWTRALALLDELEESTVKPSDRWASAAVAHQGRGELDAAQRAVLAGRSADSSALLPAVQNALLLELWVEDQAGALRAWREVIELATASEGFDSILQQFRAQIHLQRLERNQEQANQQP